MSWFYKKKSYKYIIILKTKNMNKIFKFWEKVEWYKVLVLNEREARAWAWILFVWAMFSFLNSILTWNMEFTQVFIIIFAVDFIVRMINPNYAPSLVLWRIAVSNQKPEYVWAAQKRFAWGLWLALWLFMLFAMVLSSWAIPCLGPLCLLCLVLLFFESSFGICLWCKMYNLFTKDEAQYCPGWTCEISKKEEIQKINIFQILLTLFLLISIFLIFKYDLVKWNENIVCWIWQECWSEVKVDNGIKTPCWH